MKLGFSDINALSPEEFERIREQGEEFRRALNDSVIVMLDVPNGWCINAEYRAEFGGMFPVQCRLSVADSDEFHLCICSPGEVSPYWLVVLLAGNGGLVRTLLQTEQFDPTAINQLVNKIAGMKRFNCTATTLAALLTTEVTA